MCFEYMTMPFLNDLKLNIAYASFVTCDSDWVAENVISPYSRIYYVTEGEGFLTYDGKTVVLSPGNLYFIPIGLKFNYRCDKTLKKFFFHINLLSSDYMDIFASCKEIISFESDGMEELAQDFTDGGILAGMRMKGRLYEDLYKIGLKSGLISEKVKKHSAIIEKALCHINTNLSVRLSVKDIAQSIFISPNTLRKRFSEELGISIGHYIDSRIQFEAEKLLTDTDMPIELISEKLGFCDRFYFTRKFRENNGITPAKYRKQANKKI